MRPEGTGERGEHQQPVERARGRVPGSIEEEDDDDDSPALLPGAFSGPESWRERVRRCAGPVVLQRRRLESSGAEP